LCFFFKGIRVSKADEIGVALKSLIEVGQPGVLEIDVSQILADPFRYTIIKLSKIISKGKIF
jgi:hypothetical protein